MIRTDRHPKLTPEPFMALGLPTPGMNSRGPGLFGGNSRHRSPKCSVTNFSARITGDVVLEHGGPRERMFWLEARLGEQQFRFQLSAAEFGQ